MPRVLIADDEELERKALRFILEAQAIAELELVEAENGREAVEAARAAPLDAAFLDVRMPGIDGIEAARMIRVARPGTPIVMLTAFDSFDYAREALRLGVGEYLLKPASAAEVVSALERALDGSRKLEREQRERAAFPDPEAFLAREIRSGLAEGRILERVVDEYRSLVGPPPPTESPRLALAFKLDRARPLDGAGRHALRGAAIEAAELGRVASLAERLLATRRWRALAGAGSEIGLVFALAASAPAVSAPAASAPADDGFDSRAFIEDLREKAMIDLGIPIFVGAVYCAGNGRSAEEALTAERLVASAKSALSLARSSHPLVSARASCSIAGDSRMRVPAPGSVSAGSSSAIAERALRIMAQRLGEDLSLESVAAELRVTPSHLSRRLALGAGAGFADCLARLRVDRAKSLLAAGSSVKETAALVGFRDPAYFSRVFRRFEGASPAEYRERSSVYFPERTIVPEKS